MPIKLSAPIILLAKFCTSIKSVVDHHLINGGNIMSLGYGQYCPLALAAELLCRRWTLLVISRLLDGCSGFNEIQRGIPRISPSLLSLRLKELEDYGLVRRDKLPSTKGYSYHLTAGGLALESIVTDLAIWGQQWARELKTDDLDPSFLAWSIHLRVDASAMPAGRTVIEFIFSGAANGCQRFWLINNNDKVDMCLKNPGYETDLYVRADLLRFIEVWRGFRDLKPQIASNKIRLDGPPVLVQAFPKWLLLSALAKYERRKPGRERDLSLG